ncbi:MAG: NUDIX hydrolase [Pseudomonadota bacterium]
MEEWYPHVTVATVIEEAGRFLMVEERDKASGKLVFNQPAGHVEREEGLMAAALRESLEETAWHIELTGLLGIALYSSPLNDTTYMRTTFIGTAIECKKDVSLDPDIHEVHWLDYESILANSVKMRSPLVIDSIERYRAGIRYPLEFIYGP